MKLTIKKSEHIDNWYVIERAEHDGRQWLQYDVAGGASMMDSSRFSDADVEGDASEMLGLADAIERRGEAGYKRCAVKALNGFDVINVGKRRNGKPHAVLVMHALVVMAEADAKAITKAHPGVKFVEKKAAR